MKNPLQKDVAKILPFATELPVEEDARAAARGGRIMRRRTVGCMWHMIDN